MGPWCVIYCPCSLGALKIFQLGAIPEHRSLEYDPGLTVWRFWATYSRSLWLWPMSRHYSHRIDRISADFSEWPWTLFFIYNLWADLTCIWGENCEGTWKKTTFLREWISIEAWNLGYRTFGIGEHRSNFQHIYCRKTGRGVVCHTSPLIGVDAKDFGTGGSFLRITLAINLLDRIILAQD